MVNLDAEIARARSAWDRLHEGTRPIIHIGSATCGLAAGAEALTRQIRRELRRLKVDAEVVPVGCIGMCFAEPLVDIEVPGSPRVCYAGVTPAMMKAILREHLVKGVPPARYALGTFGDEELPRYSPAFRPSVPQAPGADRAAQLRPHRPDPGRPLPGDRLRRVRRALSKKVRMR